MNSEDQIMKQLSYVKVGMLLIAIALIVSLVSGKFGMWLTVLILVSGGLTLLYSLVSQIMNVLIKPAYRAETKYFYLKIIATFMGVFLISGTLLYLYVFYSIGHDPFILAERKIQFSNAEYLFRSLICSLDLFMLDVDSNILDTLYAYPNLKGLLTIQAVLSFSCTVSMLVGLVYSRLHAYYKLNYGIKINNDKNHLYLFFGNNEPSELLIKNIVKDENDPKAVAIIIDEANIKEEGNDEWEGIVGLIAHKKSIFKTAEKIGAHVAIASQQLDEIDKDIANSRDFDAFGYLGLTKIKKLINNLIKTTNPQLHIFFMGEDEEQNIRNIIALSKDSNIMSVVKNNGLYHRIYCHARYNGPNRVIKDVALNKHLNIKIVDSSHIAIELLKFDSACHPVNVIKTSNENLATVKSTLKTLIVGFGEVGRDAFRFLYEFGAFVNSKNPNIRSPFECVIVDRNLSNIKGTFMASMPGVFDKLYKNDEVNIKFCQTDYNSHLFNEMVLDDEFIGGVNYIVISIGNNDEAIALAARIFNRARKLREDISDLRIFVHCTDDKKEEVMKKIVDHYNYGYGEGEKNVPVIQIFGQPKKTYTYDLVVSDRLIEVGKEFHKEYMKFSDEKDSWDNRHNKLTETGIPNIEKLRKLRRQESQDIANALHTGTKKILLKQSMNELAQNNNTNPDWHSFFLRYFNDDGSTNVSGTHSYINYPALSERENEIIRRIAQLEHLRWNAAHELMGYVFNEGGKECDERTLRHNCLCSWDKLDKQSEMITEWACDYKKYDFCVVDTTLAIIKDNLLYPKSNDRP